MSNNALAMDDMDAALGDIMNTTAAANGTVKNEEAHALARGKGWVKPQDFDYSTYNSADKPGADNEAIQAAWAHNAKKYEWKEEYGDVGPAIPELEQQLFRSEFINRQGVKFDK